MVKFWTLFRHLDGRQAMDSIVLILSLDGQVLDLVQYLQNTWELLS